jgi:MFS family permease
MNSSDNKIILLIKGWIDFLRRQQSHFKVNILRNLAQRFAANLTYQYQPLYLTSLGASPLILGYLNSITGLVNTLLAIPIGIAADRLGIKRVLITYTLVSIASAAIFAFSNSWEMAAVALVLSGSVFILDRTVCPMICGALDSSERVTGMGICDTISFFPQLIAPIIGATLITYFGGMNPQGIRPLFYLQVIGLLVALAILQFWFKNPESTVIKTKNSFFADIGVLFSEGRMIKRWLILVIIAAVPYQVGFYTTLFAAQIRGADPLIIGGMSTAATVVFVFFAIPLAHLSDTIGRKKIAAVSAFLTVLSYLILIIAPNNLVLILAGFLSGFNMSFIQNMMAISADLVPIQRLGSWIGLQGFCRGLVSIASPIICGYLWSYVFPQSVFYFLAATQILAIIILMLIPTEVTR